MPDIPAPGLPKDFWTRVAQAPQRLLLLDYDGTLAPFVAERERAFPYPGVRELLAEIMALEACRLVIVTGRAVADMPPLLQLKTLPEIWGCHGWERRTAAGEVLLGELPVKAEGALQRAWRSASEAGFESCLERKPASLAAHWRGLAKPAREEMARVLSAGWGELVRGAGLELHPFDGGLELRCPGRTKGDAVRELKREMAAGTTAVYLGDDLTDEDAFGALGDGDLGVLVRREPRPSSAACRIAPPEELLDFLQAWLAACSCGGKCGGK